MGNLGLKLESRILRLSERIKRELERDVMEEWWLWKVIKNEPDEKRIKIGPWVVILTNKEYKFVDEETGEVVFLSEETGWWTEEGEIFVYMPEYRTWRERVGVAVHEWLERLLVRKLGMSRTWAHRIANVVEKVLSLGKAKLYWR